MDGETFYLTRGSLRIQYRHQTKTHNLFDPKWQFVFRNYSEKVLVSLNISFTF